MYLNITLVGHLGHDPEMRYTPSGRAVTNFSVATSRKWTGNDGQPQEETIWMRVSVWGRQAETCNQYLRKGRLVLVEGRLSPDRQTGEPRIWTDQSGTPRASYEMVGNIVRFLGGSDDDYSGGGGRSQSQDGGYNQQQQSSQAPSNTRGPSGPPTDSFDEDEIPF